MSNMGYRENMVSYLEALEIEKHKIQMFQRELPLCLDLVNQAIEGCRKQLCGTSMDLVNERSDCSDEEEEEKSTKGKRKLVLEEFIPLKCCDDDDDKDVEYSREQPKDNNKEKMKSDWLRSAQLWNPSSDLLFKEDLPSSEIAMEVKGNKDGVIINKPLNKEEISSGKSKEALLSTKLDGASSSPSPASSTAETTVTTKGISGGNSSSNSNKKEDKQLNRQSPTTTTQSRRKQRRCWSHDLHRSFVEALQQLGGPDVATPKQIRELMKVDGLTNDEVKSHLQKYRLHTKRPSSANHDNMVATPPPPPPQQFVVVRGMWVPPPAPPEFPSISAAPTPSTATDLCAKIPQAASLIQKMQRQSHLTNEDRCSHGKRRVLSNSAASSSSVYASAVC